jgi:hypothetical protein
MTADVATPQPKQPSAASSHTAAAPDGRTDGAPTPFYNHLMSMIDATAEENSRAWNDDVDATPRFPGLGARMTYPVACAAGFLATLAAGGLIIATQVSRKEPPVVAGVEAPQAGSRAAVSTPSTDMAAESSLPAAGPGGPEPSGIGEKQTGDPGIITGSVPAGGSDGSPAATPAATPIESREPEMEARRASLPSVQASNGGIEADSSPPAVEPARTQPQPADAPWSLTLAPASDTDATADQPSSSPAGQIGRVISDVNMRTGPGNSQTVIATIPRGSPVEVIECQQWCEVIFTGRRGWVYASFVGPDTGARR